MVEKVDEIVGEQNDNNDAQDGHEMVYRINKCEAINSKNPFSYYERSASTLDRSFSEDSSSIRQPLLVTYSQDTASSVIVSTPSSCSEQTICEARQKTSQHKHVFTDESDVEARAGQRRKVFRARYTKKFLEISRKSIKSKRVSRISRVSMESRVYWLSRATRVSCVPSVSRVS